MQLVPVHCVCEAWRWRCA